jgi:hypothetical protein
MALKNGFKKVSVPPALESSWLIVVYWTDVKYIKQKNDRTIRTS